MTETSQQLPISISTHSKRSQLPVNGDAGNTNEMGDFSSAALIPTGCLCFFNWMIDLEDVVCGASEPRRLEDVDTA